MLPHFCYWLKVVQIYVGFFLHKHFKSSDFIATWWFWLLNPWRSHQKYFAAPYPHESGAFHLHSLPFLNAHGAVTLHILFLMQQGTPRLDVIIGLPQMLAWSWSALFKALHNSVCMPVRLSADSYATMPYPRTAPIHAPPFAIQEELL